MPETTICSFVLRFVQIQEGDPAAPWHGVIRHVQSTAETRFIDMEEALIFIDKYLRESQTGDFPPDPPTSRPE